MIIYHGDLLTLDHHPKILGCDHPNTPGIDAYDGGVNEEHLQKAANMYLQ